MESIDTLDWEEDKCVGQIKARLGMLYHAVWRNTNFSRRDFTEQ